jgi:hypothetical protein
MSNEIIKDKIIVYIGEDQEFISEINIRFKQKGVEANYFQKSYYPGVILDTASETLPNVIIFEIPTDTKNIINEEVLFLKKIPAFKSIMVIAIFPDKATLEKCPTLATSGVSFFYINGCEYEHLFRDCQLYGMENKIISPSFAKASKLKLNREFNAVSTIAGIDCNKLYLDSDVGQPWITSIKLSLNFLNDELYRDFEVIEHNTFSTLYPMTDRYILKFPFSGPWEEETDTTLRENTVRDFIDNYKGFETKKDFIWIFSEIKWPEKVFLYSLNCPFHIEYKSLQLVKSINDHEWKEPPSIFIEVKEDSEEEHSQIMELIDKIRRVHNYHPIVFILNTQFSSHDLKVRNNYGNIISSSKTLDFDFLTKVISTLASNKENNIDDLCYFKKDDINRCLNFKIDLTITSLTEHEIEFLFNAELPLFSLFQMKLPENIFITIVETETKGENMFKHTGILHGMDEHAYQNIRKIVNQLIYNPKNELTPEDIHKILHSPQAQTEQAIAKIEAATNAEFILEPKKQVIDRVFSRAKKHHKSKL